VQLPDPRLLLQVTEHICKLARKGMTPSQIGVLLRDQHGIPQVGSITGSKVLRILKGSGLAPEIPEDLYCLIKKAVSMRKHLERNRRDKDGKFRLILIESRIHRLARYYKVRRRCSSCRQQQWRQAASSSSRSGISSSSATGSCRHGQQQCS
jgi:small subunit ribosomal protein S13e